MFKETLKKETQPLSESFRKEMTDLVINSVLMYPQKVKQPTTFIAEALFAHNTPLTLFVQVNPNPEYSSHRINNAHKGKGIRREVPPLEANAYISSLMARTVVAIQDETIIQYHSMVKELPRTSIYGLFSKVRVHLSVLPHPLTLELAEKQGIFERGGPVNHKNLATFENYLQNNQELKKRVIAHFAQKAIEYKALSKLHIISTVSDYNASIAGETFDIF